jgi:hypothetical protein
LILNNIFLWLLNMPSKKELLDEYMKQLNEKEQKACQIAKEYLASSFSLEKSIGFKEWIKKKPK